MLDLQHLRNDLSAVGAALRARGYELDEEAFAALESERKALQVKTQELQSERKAASKAIGIAKSKGENAQAILDRVATLSDAVKASEEALRLLLERQREWLLEMPNLPDDDVPTGRDESDNVETRRVGDVPTFDFEVRDHVDLATAAGWLDTELAGRISGSRFAVLRGDLARLHRALSQFMLDLHIDEHGYEECNVPLLVTPDAMRATGQLPKFGDDAFATEDEPPKYLIPTSEVPLTNFAADRIYAADELPIKLAAHTACFRREAGSYGRDTRGLVRQHQFEKVELVHIVPPADSDESLEALTRHAETVLDRLELPYRTLTLCTGDMGFSAAKTYDIEVWLPGQGGYREISSCSNCRAFQARRMHARWRPDPDAKPELVHTLNGSGLAVGRALIAVVENGQTEDGGVNVPVALQPYMGGRERIG